MQFYILRPWHNELFGYRYSYADVLDPVYFGDPKEVGVCPACGESLNGRPWLPPQRVKLSKARFPDFLWGAGFDLILSERCLLEYNTAGLTGITRVDPPVEVVRVGRKSLAQINPPPPPYRNIWFNRGAASIDDELSGTRRPPGLCPVCRQGTDAIQRVILRDGSWTGCDIFGAYGLGSIIVSERLKRMAEENELTNAEFVPAEDYHFDFRDYPSGA